PEADLDPGWRHRTALGLRVGVDEVVEWLTLLRRREHDVAAGRELDAVVRDRTEIGVCHPLLLRLARVDRKPASLLVVEFRPAVISRDRAVVGVRDREADHEASGNFLAPQHPDEERMEIGAIPSLVLAGPDGIPTAPPGSALIVAHRAVDVVVIGSDLCVSRPAPAAFAFGNVTNDARERDHLVGHLIERRAEVRVVRGPVCRYPRRGMPLDDEAHDE